MFLRFTHFSLKDLFVSNVAKALKFKKNNPHNLKRIWIQFHYHLHILGRTVSIKPKFHYADFASKSTTKSADTNDESLHHKSRCRLSSFVLQTFKICVAADFAANFPRAL